MLPRRSQELGSSVQRYLEGRNNTSHAYINGLGSTRKWRAVIKRKRESLSRMIRDLKLGGKDDGQSSISPSFAQYRPASPSSSESSAERWAGPPGAFEVALKHQSTSTSASEGSHAQVLASSAATATLHSSLTSAGSLGAALECHDSRAGVGRRDDTSNDYDIGPDNVFDNIPVPLHTHSGKRQCLYQYDEGTFDDYVEHTIKGHLRQENLEQVACPYCPEILIHDSPGNHNDSTLKEALHHLRFHLPWIAGQCEWPLLHPKAFHRSDVARPHNSMITEAIEGSQLPDDELQQWGNGKPDSPVPEHQAATQSREVLHESIQVWRRSLTLRPLALAQGQGIITSSAEEPSSGAQGQGNANSSSSSAPSGKRSWPPGQDMSGCGPEDDEAENAGDRRDSKRPKKDKGKSQGLQKKLGCPCYKHDPVEYAKCAHRSFQQYSTMRNHLERDHHDLWSADWCEQCNKHFFDKSQSQYRHHLAKCRSPPGQIVEHEKASQPLNLGQLLTKKVKGGTDEEKWHKAANIMFGEQTAKCTAYTATVDHAANNAIIVALESCATDDSCSDTTQIMAKCALDPRNHKERRLTEALLKVFAQHFLSKRRDTTDVSLVQPSIEDFQAMFNDVVAERQFLGLLGRRDAHITFEDDALDGNTIRNSNFGTEPGLGTDHPIPKGPLPSNMIIALDGSLVDWSQWCEGNVGTDSDCF